MTLLDHLFPWRAGGGSQRSAERNAAADGAQTRRDVAQEVHNVGRELFRATTLLESQADALDEFTRVWQRQLELQERQASTLQRALDVLAERASLDLLRDLLPVVDAMDESIRSAREVLERMDQPCVPGAAVAAAVPGGASWLTRARIRHPHLAVLLPDAFPSHRVRANSGSIALGAGQEALKSWLDGLVLVERRLLALLERQQVRPIAAAGLPFDPHLHVAVVVERSSAVAGGTVLREELRGYTMGDRVLRHAEVVVARVRDES